MTVGKKTETIRKKCKGKGKKKNKQETVQERMMMQRQKVTKSGKN